MLDVGDNILASEAWKHIGTMATFDHKSVLENPYRITTEWHILWYR